jgi:multidrug efflux pump subunit AcrA (membrane-fusion protein)
VYEPDISRLNQTISAVVEVPDTSTAIESSRLVSIGGALDTVSRTTPVVFELENQQGALKIGVNTRVNIRIRRCGIGTVVPVSAIIDEDGKTVAYVQTSGEAFERRDVKLCIREGNLVQVVDGIKPGERVVTEGAYSLRLMSVSSQIPAHGHAH